MAQFSNEAVELKVAFALLALFLTDESAVAAPSGPMAVFQPYVGTWSCVEHIDGQPDRVSLFRFALDPTLLRETIFVPPSHLLPTGDVTNATFAFDVHNQAYVETEMGGNAVWYVSTARAPSDGTFHWTDVASATTLGRWDITLPEHRSFSIQAYSERADKTPSYRADCKRKQR